ncbi:MAG: prevent-host-death family protein [Acidimicrobiales bacterium]
MALIDRAHRMSITEATRRGVSGLVTDSAGADIVLERHGEPVAAIIAMGRIEALEEARADLVDLALVVSRAATDTGERVSFDEVLGAFGLMREGLDALSDED